MRGHGRPQQHAPQDRPGHPQLLGVSRLDRLDRQPQRGSQSRTTGRAATVALTAQRPRRQPLGEQHCQHRLAAGAQEDDQAI